MFTQPCFIRKSTPELRDKLREITGTERWLLSLWSGYCENIVHNQMNDYSTDDINWPINNDSFIDCGTNEDLFLAITALRDDSDYMQWFVCEEDIIIIDDILHKKGDFVLHEKLERVIQSNLYHKATVSELIEHFK